jgi:hypothetical protein
MTAKSEKLVQRCFQKMGKVGHFAKSGHLRSLNTDLLVLLKTFAIEKY